MDDATACLLHVFDFDGKTVAPDSPSVADLTPRLGVERGPIQHEPHLAILASFGMYHLSVYFQLVVADEKRMPSSKDIADTFGGAKLGTGGLTRPLSLSSKFTVEFLPLNQRDPLFASHQFRQIQRKTVGVVKLESITTCNLSLSGKPREDVQASIEGLAKTLLLGANNSGDVVLPRRHLRERHDPRFRPTCQPTDE